MNSLARTLAGADKEECMVRIDWPDSKRSFYDLICRLSRPRDELGNPILKCFSYLHAPEAYLFGLPISSIDLEGSEMAGANFAGCHLIAANLSRGNFDGASFERAMLDRTRFFAASLRDANLTDARLEDTLLSEATLERTYVSAISLIYTDPDWVQLAAPKLLMREGYYRHGRHAEALLQPRRLKALLDAIPSERRSDRDRDIGDE
jgi:hypothetical protein